MHLLMLLACSALAGLGVFGLGYWWGWVQEHEGEAAVRRALLRQFPEPGYPLLNHLTLPWGDGTTEMDHVLVARSGIFVIETKHYRGTLLAHPTAPQWTKVVGTAMDQFQDPLRQNSKHLKVITHL